MSERERARYRAAGQAVAALLVGAPIVRITVDGVEIAWPAGGHRPPGEILADMLIGLAGIAADSGYSYGRIRSSACVVSWRFTTSHLEDFAEARALAAMVDPDDVDGAIERVWNEALDLIAADDVWRVVERIADAIEGGALAGKAVVRILEEACSGG